MKLPVLDNILLILLKYVNYPHPLSMTTTETTSTAEETKTCIFQGHDILVQFQKCVAHT